MQAHIKNATPDRSDWDLSQSHPKLRVYTRRTRTVKIKTNPQKQTAEEKRKVRGGKSKPPETQPHPPKTLASQAPTSPHYWPTTQPKQNSVNTQQNSYTTKLRKR